MKNNQPCPVKLAKHRAFILSATLMTPLLLIPIIYTQADAQSTSQTDTSSNQSTTQQPPAATQVPAIPANTDDADNDISYDFEALQNSFVVNIDLPIDNQNDHTNAAQLVKFSSLTPSLLALIMQQNDAGLTDKQNYRLIDAKGHIMPTAVRLVSKKSTVNQLLQVVSVETDNPNAVEKLRQALTVQLKNSDNQPSVNIDLTNLPTNQVAAVTNNPVRTWWLTNPNAHKSTQSPSDVQQTVNLWLKFLPINAAQPSKRPLQLQIYGSDDLQNWQMLSQSVISPFENSQVAVSPSNQTNQPVPTGNAIAINPQQANYRYWQVVANQPINLETASLNRVVDEPSYFLTRATFSKANNASQTKAAASQWQLSLTQPMLTTGVSFFVPENQLWQVGIKMPESEANQLAKLNKTAALVDDKALANTQIDKNHTVVTWQPTLTKSLYLTGQMQQDDLPVNLMTPMYEMYFLAQGTAPYRLVINEPATLQQPSINLSDQQLANLGNTIEGQMQDIAVLDNPNASFERYKQWALWGVLAAIVAALAWIAMRLYQQTTTQATQE